jgi:hypothetical protein
MEELGGTSGAPSDCSMVGASDYMLKRRRREQGARAAMAVPGGGTASLGGGTARGIRYSDVPIGFGIGSSAVTIHARVYQQKNMHPQILR